MTKDYLHTNCWSIMWTGLARCRIIEDTPRSICVKLNRWSDLNKYSWGSRKTEDIHWLCNGFVGQVGRNGIVEPVQKWHLDSVLVTEAKSGLWRRSIVGSQLLSTFPCSSVAVALQPNIRWYTHEFGPVFCGSDKVRLYYFWFSFTLPFNASGDSPAFSSLDPVHQYQYWAAAMGCNRQPFGWHVMPAGLEQDLVASTAVGEETTVCPEQGSISTRKKDSQMGSLECGRM